MLKTQTVVVAAWVSVFVGTTFQIPAFATQATPESKNSNFNTQQNLYLSQAIPPHIRALDQDKVNEAVGLIEDIWEKDYENYFGTNFTDQSVTVKDIANAFGKVAMQTGKKPALIYVISRPQQLELVLVTPSGQPIHKRVPEADRDTLLKQVQALRISITKPSLRNTTNYLPAAQQLYQWIIAPLEPELKAQNIETLLFCMGAGLRTLPLATLHDGKQFLVEKYSTARVPAFKLTDLVYTDLRNSPVLAMGMSEFKDRDPLPAVPVELSTIIKNLWTGKSFLNQEFTLTNLQSQRTSVPYKIIHLATHASFRPGAPSNSYVEFWDTKLTLDQIRKLRWNNPPVGLLVLSGCQTAMGDEKAELGFAGLAVQANVTSAIASLWSVSDEGTLALMTQFYRDLKTAPIKAEALRLTQIAMLKGQVRLSDGQLYTEQEKTPLPPELATFENTNLSHPYYWAAFTVVGSPW